MVIEMLIIATNKYTQFVQPLIDSAKENLFPGHEVVFRLFTNEILEYVGDERVTIEQHEIPPYSRTHNKKCHSLRISSIY